MRTILVCGCVLLAIGCSRGTSNKAGTFLERGKAYLEQHDYARAILQFQNEAKLLPNSPEPYYQLGVAYAGLRDGRAALVHFKKALQLDPSHSAAQLRVAEMLALSPDKQLRAEAITNAQAVLQHAPEDADALSALALTDYRAGDQKTAEDRLTHIVETAPQHLKSAILLASLKTSHGDLSGAEEVLKSAAAHNPKSTEAAIALGRFYLGTHRPAEAQKEFQRAVDSKPDDLPAVWDLAKLQLQTGNTAAAEQNIQRLAASGDKEYRALHGTYLYNQGKREAGTAELKKLYEKDPSDRQLRATLTMCYLGLGRADEAEKVLTIALKTNPKDGPALLQRAYLLIARGKYEEARNDLNEVLRFEPNSAPAHELLASVYLARGQQLQQRQELAEAVKLNPNLLRTRISLAGVLLRSSDPKAALELMNKAPDGEKQTPSWIAERNRALFALGDRQAARKGVEDGLAVSRTRDLVLQDAQLRYFQRDYVGVRKDCEEILARVPDDVPALELLAQTYATENKPEAALVRIREQIARQPASSRLQHLLAMRLAGAGKTDEMRTALESSLKIDPNFIPSKVELARLELRDRNFASVRQITSELMTRSAAEVPARLLAAEAERKSGNSAAAIEQYRRVLDREPQNELALNNLAYMLVDEGKAIDEGLKYAQQLKELAPTSSVVDDTLGWAFYRKGIYRTSIQYLETAAAKATDALPKYHLGMAYFKAGEKTKGRVMLEAALKQNSAAPEAAAARELLSEP